VNEYAERIFEASIPVKIGIVAGAIGAIVIIYLSMFFWPLREEMAVLEKQAADLSAGIAEAKKIVANLPQFEARVAELDAELNKALAELPDKKEIPDLLSRISDKAKDAGLDIKLFRPQDEIKRDFYAEVPVQLEVYGTYHQVATFFDEVGHLQRIVNLNEFAMSEPVTEENRVNLKTTAVATSFRFLEESERPKVEEQKDKKRRRRNKSADE